ncbi:ATP-binding protein [Streptomyces hainanensis]|uniref:ATP-binding protein n=1 Tax=Streptomyces hainanensis TaxID=402648 RepID=A0A4R4THT8_9ACTN|nr:ATP-binding protein [Streptomyces hainanensis]TDC74533.1 ATP-binding protein [Streptomyces hainanensis]
MATAADSPRSDFVGEESTLDAVSEVLGTDPSIGEMQIPSRPDSLRLARELTRECLDVHWLLPVELTENAVLLVSELVGNAIQHTGAPVFGLRIRGRRGWIRIEVMDPSRALPCMLPVRRADAVNGWGVFLIGALADRWGADILPWGKSVWFEMRIATHVRHHLACGPSDCGGA